MKKKLNEWKTLQEVLGMKFDGDKWLVEGLLHTGTLSVISGQPSSFKTQVCSHLALVVAGGGEFLQHFKVPLRGRVLILDKESRWKDIQERMMAFKAPESVEIFFDAEDGLWLDDEEYAELLIKRIEEEKIGLVILDSLIRYHRGDENDSRQMSSTLAKLKKITRDTGANVIFIHHHRKGIPGIVSSDNLRGSSDIFAAVDCHISLAHKKDNDIIQVSHLKSRQSKELQPFAVKVVRAEDDTPIGLEYLGEYDKHEVERQQVKEAVLTLLKEKSGEELVREDLLQILKDTPFSKHSVLSILVMFEKKGEEGVKVRTGERNRKFYSWVGAGLLQEEKEDDIWPKD